MFFRENPQIQGDTLAPGGLCCAQSTRSQCPCPALLSSARDISNLFLIPPLAIPAPPGDGSSRSLIPPPPAQHFYGNGSEASPSAWRASTRLGRAVASPNFPSPTSQGSGKPGGSSQLLCSSPRLVTLSSQPEHWG